jgi:hypothetical protein
VGRRPVVHASAAAGLRRMLPIVCEDASHTANVIKYSKAVNFCWPSPAKSFLILCPIGAHDHIFVLSNTNFMFYMGTPDRLWGLVVRVPGYRSRGPGSIPGDVRFSEK